MSHDLHTPLTDDELDARLRSTFATVMPRLDDSSMATDGSTTSRVEPDDAAVLQLSDGRSARSRRWMAGAASVAAATVLVVVGFALTQRDQVSEPVVGQSSPSTQLADLPETAQVDDGPTTIDYEVAPPVNTLIPQVCGSGEGDDCSPYAPLPVADGVSDFYIGPADLGTPVVALHELVPLVRWAELDPSATVCNRLEGWAGVALTRYPSEVTVDTTGVELVPRQATFARLTSSRSARSYALRLRQMM